ncbi:MAG: methyl-accepting chemotaxis protein, partial [Nitrospinales bacterium]
MSFFRIPAKLYSLVFVLLLFFAGVVLYTVSVLNDQKQDGGVINLAGKQRMLTQKLSKSIMELQLGNTDKVNEINRIKDEFQKVLDGLKNGSAQLNLPAAETPKILAQLEEVENKWAPFATNLDRVVDLWPSLQEKLNTVMAADIPLYNEASDLVDKLKGIMDVGSLSTAGRMVSVTQRVSKAVSQFVLYRNEKARDEGLKFLALQNMITDGLLEGNPGLGLEKVEDMGIRESIKSFQTNWKTFQDQIEAIFRQLPEVNEASKYISDHNMSLLKSMNSAVQEMSGYSQKKVESMITTEYMILAILFVLGLVASFWLIRTITRPLNEVSERMGKMAQGSLKQERIVVGTNDEVGLLGTIFNQLLGNLNQLHRQAEAIAQDRLDQGVLNMRVHGDLGEAFARMTAKMKWFAEQAAYIANNDLYHDKLVDNGSGTLGSSMAAMVRNLRDTAKNEEASKSEIESLLKQTEEQAALQKRQAEELQTKVDSMLEVVNAAAQGDLTRKITVSGEDAIGQLGDGLAAFLFDLRSSISSLAVTSRKLIGSSDDLSRVSEGLSANSEETSAQAGVVSSASEEVSKNVQTVASGAEEMTVSIQEIADSAGKAARVAVGAVKVAESANNTVNKLGRSSGEIG